ncbi:hypothetical protein BD310DRAFT_684738 [Dichomitus squalens]|uniref:Uncharacterized protein n=1 Tax=Dichomitus squalens TaxID=114155 RepID=A0A4Q9PMP7_9APHY|nr:hypothetical protein BD310DRAFT_684738 [Dichomitus squalens]
MYAREASVSGQKGRRGRTRILIAMLSALSSRRAVRQLSTCHCISWHMRMHHLPQRCLPHFALLHERHAQQRPLGLREAPDAGSEQTTTILPPLEMPRAGMSIPPILEAS